MRAIAICEDSRHRSFLLRLFEALGVRDGDSKIEIAPHGRGSAEQWVRSRAAKEVRAFRARTNHQRNLFLLFMTDGDRFGVVQRKASLDAQLENEGISARSMQDKIVYLVPTWSVETWLIWLCGEDLNFSNFAEATAFKDNPTYTALAGAERLTTKLACSNWRRERVGESSSVPSLSDARRELERIPQA